MVGAFRLCFRMGSLRDIADAGKQLLHLLSQERRLAESHRGGSRCWWDLLAMCKGVKANPIIR